jgi:phosphoglucomutase
MIPALNLRQLRNLRKSLIYLCRVLASKLYAHSLRHLLVVALPQSYTDPVDGSKTSKQGLTLSFEYPNGDPARVVYRLSGTGSAGATIRMYLEKFEGDDTKHGQSAPAALKSLADKALQLVHMVELTGRDAPTVIT